MTFAILGMGAAVPSTCVDQAVSMKVARKMCCKTREQESWLPAVYAGSGIDQRYMAIDWEVLDDLFQGTNVSGSAFLPKGAADDRGPTTSQRMDHYAAQAGALALRASRQALEQSGLFPEEITHLITVSCTGFRAPGVDIELIQGLGLHATTQRTHLGFMGCHGALNGLRVAQAFTGSNPDARVLLCATELCSPHYHYNWDPQKMIANALFADGSAAVVGVPIQRAPADAWKLAACGACVFPDSLDAMTWNVGDHGFVMTLSKRVPSLIASNLRPWMEKWLAGQGLSLREVVSWAIHPGGPRILEAAEEALGLPRETTWVAREVFASHGNMSSPTVLFILDELRRRHAPRPCLALGFGPGLAAEAALFR
jgi:prepilin-type processing-associated H-X9-DG protein